MKNKTAHISNYEKKLVKNITLGSVLALIMLATVTVFSFQNTNLNIQTSITPTSSEPLETLSANLDLEKENISSVLGDSDSQVLFNRNDLTVLAIYPDEPTVTNLIKNGLFAQGLSPWQKWIQKGGFMGVYTTSQKLKILVAKPGKAQIYQKDIKITKGQKYRLQYELCSNTKVGIRVDMFKHGYFWNNVGYKLVKTINKGCAKYVSAWTANRSEDNTRLRFYFPYAAKGHFYVIDNVILEEI
mgnify:CR=1 FL=1